ncbi:conserved Plasmodium protein, unknown function [Plasmodium reichenowi]|uniref:Uncharacterized protein n=1 Tax=Plasmodium reichenowi TaxID=5854 RepID=A0A060RQH1_PLARE|nr:hypothetical protein PRSY57_0717500 [Plasmodium reichenowi]KYO00507.1 hypothetical protein PRSY57_0717500 [Plasmodium reichenowi]CDO63660.1 conserved Plasmodium protein, unknown function [Plasmodium reichenowi]SOV77835.1 conserved Plasmodium protein, unknown function [Plasmodium reichenowi]
MSNINTVKIDYSEYRTKRVYNPKVHVSGWYDIQNDLEYIEHYNKEKEFYIAEYPKNKFEKRYKNMNRKSTKNISDKKVIFYQEGYESESWVTENKESYKVHETK